jgi:hypothetical protein
MCGVLSPFTAPGIAPSGDTTGTTDTLGLQAAINRGGVVQLQAGTFRVTTLALAAGVRLTGAGPSTILQSVSTGTSAANMITWPTGPRPGWKQPSAAST